MTQRDTTQIRIKQTTHEHLKEVSERTGVGMMELVERAVARVPIEEADLADIAIVQPRQGTTTLHLQCEHQHGQIYVVEGAQNNWVCKRPRVPGHSLAGFFKDLVQLDETRVKRIMQSWGIYYRSLPLADQEETQVEASEVQLTGGTGGTELGGGMHQGA